jgi:hypothetical protein
VPIEEGCVRTDARTPRSAAGCGVTPEGILHSRLFHHEHSPQSGLLHVAGKAREVRRCMAGREGLDRRARRSARTRVRVDVLRFGLSTRTFRGRRSAMRVEQIKTFENFVERLAQPFEDDERTYRGVSRESYRLVPTLGRMAQYDDDQLRGYEWRTVDEFRRRAKPLVPDAPADDWEWLFLAQHHGLPTRLLDWTSNPLVALFFAVSQDDQFDGAIYCGGFNRLYHTGNNLMVGATRDDRPSKVSPYEIEGVHAVYPAHRHQRYVNQSGFFTIQHHPTRPIEDHVDVKYIVPQQLKARCRSILQAFGITWFFLFPSLDELIEDIRSRWDHLESINTAADRARIKADEARASKKRVRPRRT